MSNLPPRTGISPVDRDIEEIFARLRALEAAPPGTLIVPATVTGSAGNVQALQNLLTALDGEGVIVDGTLSGDYATYTPTVTGSVSDPTFTGNIGSWVQIGLFVHAIIAVQKATFTDGNGSGDYDIELPVAASGDNAVFIGSGVCQQFSSGIKQPVSCILVPHAGGPTNQWIQLQYPATWPAGALTIVGSATPFSWVSGDFIGLLDLVYKADTLP